MPEAPAPPPPAVPPWDTADVAAYLRCDETTVRKLTRTAGLPVHRLSRSLLRYDRREVEAWFAARRSVEVSVPEPRKAKPVPMPPAGDWRAQLAAIGRPKPKGRPS